MTSSSTQLSQFSQITITHNDITNEVYRTTVSSVTSVNRHIWPNFYRLLRLVGSQDRTHDRTFRSRSFRSRSRSFRFGLRSSVNYAQSYPNVDETTRIWVAKRLVRTQYIYSPLHMKKRLLSLALNHVPLKIPLIPLRETLIKKYSVIRSKICDKRG